MIRLKYSFCVPDGTTCCAETFISYQYQIPNGIANAMYNYSLFLNQKVKKQRDKNGTLNAYFQTLQAFKQSI